MILLTDRLSARIARWRIVLSDFNKTHLEQLELIDYFELDECLQPYRPPFRVLQPHARRDDATSGPLQGLAMLFVHKHRKQPVIVRWRHNRDANGSLLHTRRKQNVIVKRIVFT